MGHLITFFYLIAACFGFFSLGIAFVSYRKNGSATIRRLLNLELALGSLFLCLFLWHYGTIAIGVSDVSEYLSLVLHIVSYVALYCFVLLVDAVIGTPSRGVANVLLAAFLIGFSLFLMLMPFSEAMRSNPVMDELDDLVIIPIGVYVIVRSFLLQRNDVDPRSSRNHMLVQRVTLIAVLLVIGDSVLLGFVHTVFLFPLSFIVWNILFLKWIGSSAIPPVRSTVTLDDEKLSVAGITKREREMIIRLLSGDTYVMIGDKECISVHTVKSHVSSVYRKLKVKNRYQLRDVLAK